jgi:mono/diheme cytochrome c family protein
MRSTFVLFAPIAAIAALVAACSSSSSSTENTTPDAAASLTPAQAGQLVIKSNDCGSCHGKDFSGSTHGIPNYPSRNAPNITPDKSTGIGGWTDAQIKGAIAAGTDDQGQDLCWVMPRFNGLSGTEIDNVVAYLRSLPAVSQNIPDSECPGDGGKSNSDASKD